MLAGMMTNDQLWQRYKKNYVEFPEIGLSMDISRMNFGDDFFAAMRPRILKAFSAMKKLEKGVIANPDEKRMVGHYWLRNPALAPQKTGIAAEVEGTLKDIQAFAADVHAGKIKGAKGAFKNLLVIGIGGSALGPQFVANALSQPATDKLETYFFDNTDPDGMDKVLAALGKSLGQTLCVVISKSGGTKETRNGMLEAKAAYDKAKLKFAQHAVAITQVDSQLDKLAVADGWIQRFPMWDWVGGRTSVTSAVGLLPAALQGFDIAALLEGARACDEVTRSGVVKDNPAAQLALMWYYAGGGKGKKDMVVLPYKDRLELLSKYLQQLIMESLGKEKDLNGNVVNQGIAVYGNKGSTDQHAYVQQLRDGVNNFFVTFIEVLRDRTESSMEVEPGVTSGDFLSGFLYGTRQALFESGRESITISIKEVSPFSIGVLIALYERAVGLYAALVNINAYHQPGVEAGKKAAGVLIALQLKVVQFLKDNGCKAFTAEQIAASLGEQNQVESVFRICEHMAANPDRGIMKADAKTPIQTAYQAACSCSAKP